MIKASLILMLTYCVSKVLSHRSAAERHLLWVGAIGSAAFLPLFSLVLPEWRSEMTDRIAAVVVPVMSRSHVAATHAGGSTLIHAYAIQGSSKVAMVLLVIWSTGFLLALLSLAAGSRTLKRLTCGSLPLSDPGWLQVATDLPRTFGIKRTIRLMQSDQSIMPLTTGT